MCLPDIASYVNSSGDLVYVTVYGNAVCEGVTYKPWTRGEDYGLWTLTMADAQGRTIDNIYPQNEDETVRMPMGDLV